MTGSLCKGWGLFQEKSSTFRGVTLFPLNRNEQNFRNIKWYLLVVQLNATIFFGTRNRKQTKAPSTRIRWIQAANKSATFWGSSPEWKFLNTLWMGNRVYAKSGYFLSGDVTRSTPVFLPSIFKMVPRAMSSFLYYLDFSFQSYNLCAVQPSIITVHFNYAKRMLHVMRLLSMSNGS